MENHSNKAFCFSKYPRIPSVREIDLDVNNIISTYISIEFLYHV